MNQDLFVMLTQEQIDLLKATIEQTKKRNPGIEPIFRDVLKQLDNPLTTRDLW